MKNALYHEFTVGFNWCFVVGPILLLAVIAAAYFSVQTKKTKYGTSPHVYLDNKSRIAQIIIAIVSFLYTFEVGYETIDGLIQLEDNRLGQYESGVWSLIIAIFELMMFGMIVYVVFSFIYSFVQSTRKKYLSAIYEAQKERYMRNEIAVEKDNLHETWYDTATILAIATSPNVSDFDSGILYMFHKDLNGCLDDEEATEVIARYAKKLKGDEDDK